MLSKVFAMLCIGVAGVALDVQAADRFRGVSFHHHDWELACDNTLTCRAAGYQGDGEELAIAVLLTREAGARQPVKGEVMLGDYDSDVLGKLPDEFELALNINARSFGTVTVRRDSATGKLSARQVAALLAAFPYDSSIELSAGEYHWQLSDEGAAAVLLKMDEVQGRVGTPGAVIRKGRRTEDAVLTPQPLPVVIAAPLAQPRPGDDQWIARQSKPLRDALQATIKEDDYCPEMTEGDFMEAKWAVHRLTETRLLVSTQCWMGAYNFGSGYWVVEERPPYHPVLVTTSGSDYGQGSIDASHKGRGLGDCWSSDTWIWDGREFVHTDSATTGMCKLVAPGGAWSLPTIRTEVRALSR